MTFLAENYIYIIGGVEMPRLIIASPSCKLPGKIPLQLSAGEKITAFGTFLYKDQKKSFVI